MNLWLRLIWMLVMSPFQKRMETPSDVVALNMRVWPTDLDLSLHMNNGRYLTIMDLGRLAFLFRSELLEISRRQRLTPMVVGIAIRYRRELRPFQRYTLRTQIVGWHETTVVFEQAFITRGGRRDGQVAARALVRAGLYDRANKSFGVVSELLAAAGSPTTESPPLSGEVMAFLELEEQMRVVDRSARQEPMSVTA